MKALPYLLTCLIVLSSCSQTKTPKTKTQQPSVTIHPQNSSTQSQPKMTYDTLRPFNALEIDGHKLDVASPPSGTKVIGNILILQGFAFPKDDWCQKSSLCRKALAKGYRLIMPEMGKSTYSSKFYPETREDWKIYPRREWLVKTVFGLLQQKYGILLPSQHNYIIGLSTGGRGVALIALDRPDLFTACAALSGDFDQTKMPQDRVMTGYYGPYQKFPQRWATEDNILHQIEQWQTPIYIGHGLQDKVVPASQSKLFYDALAKQHPDLPKKLNMPQQHAHNYQYWDAEVDHMLDFFEEVTSNR